MASSFHDRHALAARLGHDGPRRVRVGAVVSLHRIPRCEATEAPFDAGEAHPTLAACQEVLQERLTEWALAEATNPDLKTTTRPTFVLVQDKNSLKAKRIHAYRCLPDTVDPRGPKGK